jgi:hypothetical protein
LTPEDHKEKLQKKIMKKINQSIIGKIKKVKEKVAEDKKPE